MAIVRIHNKRSYARFELKNETGKLETHFLDAGKFLDIESRFITEDVFNKSAFGILKLEIRKADTNLNKCKLK